MAGASLSQGHVHISWQVQHFRKVECKIRGRRIIFARSSTDFVAGAALSQSQVQNSRQAHHFRKVKYRFRGRCSTLARSSAKFVAGASLSQGQVQNSWQVQHFRKVKCKIKMRGRRITFARSSTDFVAGAALSQGQVHISWQAQHFCKVPSPSCTGRPSDAATEVAFSQLHTTKPAEGCSFSQVLFPRHTNTHVFSRAPFILSSSFPAPSSFQLVSVARKFPSKLPLMTLTNLRKSAAPKTQ